MLKEMMDVLNFDLQKYSSAEKHFLNLLSSQFPSNVEAFKGLSEEIKIKVL